MWAMAASTQLGSQQLKMKRTMPSQLAVLDEQLSSALQRCNPNMGQQSLNRPTLAAKPSQVHVACVLETLLRGSTAE